MDINDQIAKHTGLIYTRLTAFNLLYDQDAESYAYEALHRAILTFNEASGNAFSTYAVCCINNELRKYLRTTSKKRQLDVVSYYAPLTSDDESVCLADILEHPVNVESALISDEVCTNVLCVLHEEYKQLPEKHKRVIELFYDSDNKVTQKDIATSVGIAQATVSKIVSAFRHRVKLRLEYYE